MTSEPSASPDTGHARWPRVVLLVFACSAMVAIVLSIVMLMIGAGGAPATSTSPPKRPAPSGANGQPKNRTGSTTATRQARTAAREARAARQQAMAEAREAYSAESVGVNAATLSDIRQALDAFLAAAKSQPARPLNDQEFSAEAFVTEMFNSPSGKELDKRNRRYSYRLNVEQSLVPPRGWVRYHIACVDRPGNASQAVASCHMYHDSNYSNPVRFWLVHEQSRWKIYDWELVEFGERESHRWALDQVAPENYELTQLMEEVNQADGLVDGRKREEAQRLLKTASSRSFADPRRDAWMVRLAYAWLYGGWWDEAILACRQVERRDRVPGVYLVEAQAQVALDRPLKALAMLERYEQLVGPMPQARKERLGILERLDRYDDAVKQCQWLLALEPESLETMKRLGRALGENDKQVLVEHVAKLNTPLPQAVELAEMFASYRDAEGLGAMTALVRRLDPKHKKLKELKAREARIEGRDAEAAAVFLDLLKQETDEKRTDGLLWSYLECMIAGDKAVAGYEAVPDAAAAFRVLTSGDDDEPTLEGDDLARVVELHLKRMPNDPRGHFQAAVLRMREKKYDEALAELGKAEALAPKPADQKDESGSEADQLRQSIRYQRILAMHGAGLGLEAYHAIAPADETFQILARLYEEDESQTAALETLIASHRRVHPGDPWLGYFGAKVEMRRGRYLQAERMIRQTLQRIPQDDYRQGQLWNLWLECRQKQGRMVDAWRGLKLANELFGMVASRLEGMEDWPQLRQAVDAYRREYPQDPQGIVWMARWCQATKNDAQLAALLEPWPAAADTLHARQRSQLKQQLTEAWWRLGKKDEAWAAARKLADEDENLLPLIYLSAAEGDVSQTLDAMLRREAHTYRRGMLYDDDDLGAALRGPKFLPVRKQFPPELPRGSARHSAVLLLDAPPVDPRPAIQQVLGPQAVFQSIQDASVADTAMVAHSSVGRILYSASAAGKYHDPPSLDGVSIKNEALRSALADHKAWLAVDVVQPRGDQEAARLSGRLAAALVGTNCRAVYWEGRLMLPEVATKGLANGPWNGPTVKSLGEEIWLDRAESTDPADRRWISDRPRSLKSLDSRFQKARGEEFFVQVRLEVGHVAMRPWLKLLRMENSGRMTRTFVCEATSESPLLPDVTPGEPFVVRTYDVWDWKQVAAGQTQFGRAEAK